MSKSDWGEARSRLLAELAEQPYGEMKQNLPGEKGSLTAGQLADVISLSVDMLMKHPAVILHEEVFAEVYEAGQQVRRVQSSLKNLNAKAQPTT